MKKLKLNDLKVNSFLTSHKARAVFGGTGEIDTNEWSNSLCGPETIATGNCCVAQ
jgi:hypothetical protein